MAIDSCLVDTNILLRTNKARLFITLTRISQNSGTQWPARMIATLLDWVRVKPNEKLRPFEAGMSLLADGEAIYREWRRIVTQFGILGVQVHDARLAAAMYVHRLGHILTLNVSDFSRFPGLAALHPNSV
jgi:predicted nucleic acid-binding protein